MSLPLNNTSEEYFETCIKFFKKYHYLISSPNTHILIDNVLDHVNIEGLEDAHRYEDGSKLSDLRNRSTFLDDFLTNLKEISCEDEVVDTRIVDVDFNVPMAEKKKYEVVRLAEEVKKICKETGCDTVVDIGSGLGYLDQRLFETTSLNVLGVECSPRRLSAARERQRRLHAGSRARVAFERHAVDAHSASDIERLLGDNFGSHGPVCVTGLHACGDLTVDGITVFLKMQRARTLILMPCCYHRMKLEGNRFKNFPLSTPLKRACERLDAFDLLQIPFLRLACHPATNERPLTEMVFCLLARAVLQLYAWRNKYTLKRDKRRPIKRCATFDSYIAQARDGYTLTLDQDAECPRDRERVEFDLEELRAIWASLSPSAFARAAVYIQLQAWAAPAGERLVLSDRMTSAGEAGGLREAGARGPRGSGGAGGACGCGACGARGRRELLLS